MNDRDLFCQWCGVSMGLHDGPDSCDHAEAKADLLERFGFFGGSR